jgi:hypothetical protein
VVRQVRESYRRNAGIVRREDCRNRDIVKYGEMREVIFPDGSTKRMKSFLTEELADLIGRNTQVLYRWRSDFKWPETVFKVKHGPKSIELGVYVKDEVKALVEVFGAHQKETPYYHGKAHSATREKLFAAIAEVREKLGVA